MKVLHVLPSLSPRFGGPSEVALSTVRRLRELHIDAEILTTSHDAPELFADVRKGVIEARGSRIHVVPAPSRSGGAYLPSHHLLAWLRQNVCQYDLLDLHYLFTFSTSVASRLAVAHRVPYTVRLMGQCEPWAIKRHGLRKRIYLASIDKHLFRNASAVQCTSQLELKNAELLEIPNLVHAPLGVDEQIEPYPDAHRRIRQRLGVSEDTAIILYLSRIDRKKRLDRVVELLPRVRKTRDAVLVVCGSGDAEYRGEIETMAQRAGVSEFVHFLGHVGEQEKEMVLQGSNLMILLSESENFACAAAEALVRGLPVLVSPMVGIVDDLSVYSPEMVTHTPDDALESVLTLLSDGFQSRSKRAEMSQWSVAHLGWRARISATMTLYQEILSRRGGRIG